MKGLYSKLIIIIMALILKALVKRKGQNGSWE